MKSVAQALFWEFFWHNNWLPLLLLAIGNALPLFVLTAMSGLQVDLNSKELAMLQVMMPFCSVMVALGVSLGQGPISRLYLKPISTAKLVACFFTIGAIPISFGIAGSIALWNYSFGLSWPVICPTVFGVTFWIAIWPSTRVQMISPLRLAEVFLVVIGMFIWSMQAGLRGQHTSIPTWDWSNFDLFDYATLAAIVATSYGISVRRASLDRCGKNSSWIIESAIRFLNAWDERGYVRNGKFANRLKANLWYEQNTRDLSYVAGIAVFIAIVAIVAIGALLLQNRADLNLANWGDSLTLVFLLHIPFAGFFGLLIPMLRLDAISDAKDLELSELSRERTGAMSEFRSALPITDVELAKSAIQSIQYSLLWVHAMFATIGLGYWALLQFFDATVPAEKTAKLPWLIAIGVLGSWSTMANATALAYWGRWRIIFGITATLGVIAVVAPVSMAHAGVALLLMVVLGFAKMLHKALRQVIVSQRETAVSVTIASLVSLFFCTTLPQDFPPFTSFYTTILAVLVVMPIPGM